MEERKLIVVMDSGPLPELGGIGGPIITPTRVVLSAVKKLLVNGRTVYACDPMDPRNKDKRVLLDMTNVVADNFAVTTEDVPEEVEPEFEQKDDKSEEPIPDNIPTEDNKQADVLPASLPEPEDSNPQKTDNFAVTTEDVPEEVEPGQKNTEGAAADTYQ